MIKSIMYITLLIILSMASIYFFMRALDAAIEISDLKSQIRLQQEDIEFLRQLANDALTSCKTTVEQLETIAKANNYSISWYDQTGWLGPFKVTKNGLCISKIEKIGL